jgi:hypothetical protein
MVDEVINAGIFMDEVCDVQVLGALFLIDLLYCSGAGRRTFASFLARFSHLLPVLYLYNLALFL